MLVGARSLKSTYFQLRILSTSFLCIVGIPLPREVSAAGFPNVGSAAAREICVTELLAGRLAEEDGVVLSGVANEYTAVPGGKSSRSTAAIIIVDRDYYYHWQL